MTTSFKNKRKKMGFSQEELSKILGISRPTLIKIEKGERKMTVREKEKFDGFVKNFDADEESQTMRVNIPQERTEKFKQVFLYILEKVGAKPNVGLTVLYKLLYFIDFDYYEKYEEQLMGLTYFKNTHGPTPRNFAKVVEEMKRDGEVEEIRSKFFSHDQKKFLPRVEADLSGMSGRELEMVDDVLSRYADKSATQLSNLSHRDMPWKATKELEDIDYECVFYRSEEFSVRDYGEL
jgi:transcriptional regulator with XRE-family HTH domain